MRSFTIFMVLAGLVAVSLANSVPSEDFGGIDDKCPLEPCGNQQGGDGEGAGICMSKCLQGMSAVSGATCGTDCVCCAFGGPDMEEEPQPLD